MISMMLKEHIVAGLKLQQASHDQEIQAILEVIGGAYHSLAFDSEVHFTQMTAEHKCHIPSSLHHLPIHSDMHKDGILPLPVEKRPWTKGVAKMKRS